MTLAIVLVIAAALGLFFIFYIGVSRSLQPSRNAASAAQLQPVDVAAFRNLVDPAEADYLRRRLSTSEFRTVQRKRLRAMAAYVQVVGRNAAILIEVGNAARSSNDPQTAEAARELANNAMQLYKNSLHALFMIYFTLLMPGSNLAATPILLGYERLSSSAMLLGRLQNPTTPVRISATS